MEEWKPVAGYEGFYSVSNKGRIWSHYHDRPLKLISGIHGYLIAHLSKNGIAKRIPVHRLVAQAFIANPDNKPTVNHLNEVKTDNTVENLEWATVAEQNVYGTRIVRAVANTDWAARSEKMDYAAIASKHNYFEMNKQQMKPVLQYDRHGFLIARHESVSEAARCLGIRPSHICCCLKGRRNSCGGFKWLYA